MNLNAHGHILYIGDSESSDEKSRRPVQGKRKQRASIDEDDGDEPIAPKTRKCRRSIRQRQSVEVLSAKDRNLRRLESNERERLRMHSLNDAFEVSTPQVMTSDPRISL